MNDHKILCPETKHQHGGCGFHCIKINDVTVRLGKDLIVDDVSLHMHCGTLTVLIGRNGAGKTTLLRAILGEVRHTGTVEFKNLNASEQTKMKIGYVPQSLNIERNIPITVYDMFASLISNHPVWLHKNKKLRDEIADRLKLFSVEDCIDSQVGKLSGGQLQRVLLSIAITPMPNLLILDEPVSGIDYNGVREFYALVNDIKEKYDLAILMISHDLDLVEKFADKVILLDHKILCEGTPKEVYANENFKKIFGEGK